MIEAVGKDTEEKNQGGAGPGVVGWHASPLRLAFSVSGMCRCFTG